MQDRLNIAVFVDYDNIEIGVKSTLRREFDVSLPLGALKERGDIVAKFAYANWGRQDTFTRQLSEHAVQMVQSDPSPRGDKNGADINLALDALEMALWARRLRRGDGLVHHSDRGSQYLAIRYTERLAEEGAVTSVGSRGDSYDNALAETVMGLYKTELIRRRGPWRTAEQVELATAEWVDWWNRRRLHSAASNLPPAEFEQRYHDQIAVAGVA